MSEEQFKIKHAIGINIAGEYGNNFFHSLFFDAISQKEFLHLLDWYFIIRVPCYKFECIFDVNEIIIGLFDFECLHELLECYLILLPKGLLTNIIKILL